MSDNFTMHVISHTHWDREWYMPFQHFRMRLVDLTDNLIDLMESNPDFKYWNFDGQTIVLEDYLEIRPENEKRLRKLVKEGRILIGPWYNQPDEWLVSGESLIRNLMLGRKMGDEWGNWLSVGYVPDCFGHISQFPQLMQGFGIDNAVLFRAITTDQVKSEFTWEGADGSQVLCIKLPDNNAYSNFFYRMRESLMDPNQPLDPEKVIEQLNGLVDDCINEKPTTDVLLFMDGVDHCFPQFKTPEIIKIGNEKLGRGTLKHSTLPAFIEDVRSKNPELQTYKGELRHTNRNFRLQGLLHGTFSSRMHLKQMNNYCQNLMERWVEPFSAIAWSLGGKYESSYIARAWKYLLQNSPHDSICGCSIDQVHKDMVYRYDQTRLIGERLLNRQLKFIVDKIGSDADNPERTTLLTVFNPLNWERTDIIETSVSFRGHLPFSGIRITDPEGNEVPYSFIGMEDYGDMEPMPYDIPLGTHFRKWKIAFLAQDVPAMGYKSFKVETLETINRQEGSLIINDNTATNGKYRVVFMDDGTFEIYDNETSELVAAMLGFDDGGDFGDGWRYVKPAKDTVVTSTSSKARISVLEDSPVRAVFEISTEMEVPREMHPNRQQRSDEWVKIPIRQRVSVARGIDRVDVETTVLNTAKDHKLRVLFSGFTSDATVSYAESAFDVVERPITVPPCTDWKEPLPKQHPQKTFSGVSDGVDGIAILNQGLPEFEVKDDEIRTIALTLLRSVIGGVQGPDNQKGGQMPGEHTFRYSIYPHSGTWEEAEVWQQGHQFNTPMIGVQTDIHEGELPLEKSFIDAGPDAFLVTALKKADREDALVLRGFNIGSKKIDARVSADGFTKVVEANLNEEPQGKEKKAPAKLGLEAKKIATVLLRK